MPEIFGSSSRPLQGREILLGGSSSPIRSPLDMTFNASSVLTRMGISMRPCFRQWHDALDGDRVECGRCSIQQNMELPLPCPTDAIDLPWQSLPLLVRSLFLHPPCKLHPPPRCRASLIHSQSYYTPSAPSHTHQSVCPGQPGSPP